MIKNNETIKLGKKGVNYVTTVVDECNCNFNPIFQENDIGIDGQIELFSKERIPTGNLIAVQIKTGKSYYDLKNVNAIFLLIHIENIGRHLRCL